MAVDQLVTAVIPHIPTRHSLLLSYALPSVYAQDRDVIGTVIVETDYAKEGAGTVRNRAIAKIRTPWLAFLDDDDHWFPHHLSTCLDVAAATDADVVVPWFQTNGRDPFPPDHCRGNTWDPDGHVFPITCLVRRDVVGDTRFPPPGPDPSCAAEDGVFWRDLARRRARIVTIPDVTWFWNHAPPGGNTSGSPVRW
jgi:glycosyltransferase involved in cell wall biosynthesis